MSFYLDMATSFLDWDQLSYLRERAQMERRGGIAETDAGSETFAVMPYGKHPYRYILINKAFEVRLAEHNQPNCHVRFSSEALWREGAENLLIRLRAWFASLAMLERRSEGVSRADWAFDFHLPEIDFTEDHFVSRANKDAKHRENGLAQTFRFGQGDIVVRVYDKCAAKSFHGNVKNLAMLLHFMSGCMTPSQTASSKMARSSGATYPNTNNAKMNCSASLPTPGGGARRPQTC